GGPSFPRRRWMAGSSPAMTIVEYQKLQRNSGSAAIAWHPSAKQSVQISLAQLADVAGSGSRLLETVWTCRLRLRGPSPRRVFRKVTLVLRLESAQTSK